MSTIVDNLAQLNDEISALCVKYGRSQGSVKLIAVSKTRSIDEVKMAIEAGQCDFGENTVQDAMTKIPFLNDGCLEWHFIGHLQTKKVKHIPGHFSWLHSVDDIKLVEKLGDAIIRQQTSLPVNCLLQVNISGETSKYGLKSVEVMPFLEKVLKAKLEGIQWRGLMTMGVRDHGEATRSVFGRLRQLLQQCQSEFGLADFNQLSMGMSDDYELAIAEGATMIRIGTRLFGPRGQLIK